MKRGFILLWREIEEKDVWKNARGPWRLVLIHILLNASYKEGKWKNPDKNYVEEATERGTFISSLEEISRKTTASIQEVRSALEYFSRNGLLTRRVTRRATYLTVVNWDVYQGSQRVANTTANSDLTADQQPTPIEVTTSKEVKNLRIQEREREAPRAPEPARPQQPTIPLSSNEAKASPPKPSTVVCDTILDTLAKNYCPEESKLEFRQWWREHVTSDNIAVMVMGQMPAWAKFRDLYPNHSGIGAAFLWWAQNVRADSTATEILSGLERWMASATWIDGIGIPYAINFLRNRVYAKVAGPPPRKQAVPGGRVAQNIAEATRMMVAKYGSQKQA